MTCVPTPRELLEKVADKLEETCSYESPLGNDHRVNDPESIMLVYQLRSLLHNTRQGLTR